jgi:hypothetical protein
MLIFKEKKAPPKEATAVLEDMVRIMGRLATATSRLAMKLVTSQLLEDICESALAEGTPADRKFVADKIKEIQAFVKELDTVNLIFERKSLETSFMEKQQSLMYLQGSIPALHANMLTVWSMKDSGDTPEANKRIKLLLFKMFDVVNTDIQQLNVYVKTFNLLSAKKLSFKVKWTDLPDD